jgi:acetyl-CoA carboxylase carboxyl transferase subunit alpha
MSNTLKTRLSEQLDELQAVPLDELLERRYQRLMSYGKPD